MSLSGLARDVTQLIGVPSRLKVSAHPLQKRHGGVYLNHCIGTLPPYYDICDRQQDGNPS